MKRWTLLIAVALVFAVVQPVLANFDQEVGQVERTYRQIKEEQVQLYRQTAQFTEENKVHLAGAAVSRYIRNARTVRQLQEWVHGAKGDNVVLNNLSAEMARDLADYRDELRELKRGFTAKERFFYQEARKGTPTASTLHRTVVTAISLIDNYLRFG